MISIKSLDEPSVLFQGKVQSCIAKILHPMYSHCKQVQEVLHKFTLDTKSLKKCQKTKSQWNKLILKS